MALCIGPNASFDNIESWKEIREKSGEVNSAKVCMRGGDISHNRCYTNVYIYIKREREREPYIFHEFMMNSGKI
jgi:hypothetical protein